MVIELHVVQFWSEIILVISNRTHASREGNHFEQPFDFLSSMCEVRRTPRDVFDVNSSSFAGNHYTTSSFIP